MKVLYIGYVRENKGWSRAAANNIRALESVGIDIVYRDIRLTQEPKELPEDIIECEKKDLNGVDICIQHVLPHHLVKTGKYRNVAFLEYENESLRNTCWIENLKMMDEVWAPNEELAKLIEKECNTKSLCIPHACNITSYYEVYDSVKIPGNRHKYNFYTICDLNQRKNIESTIRAFHATFDRDEPVSLILKVKGGHPKELEKRVSSISKDIKISSRLYKNINSYKKEIIITEDINDYNIMSLHQYCDCFVNTSHGEAWSIPTFDAMAFGNRVISSPMGASQFLKDYKGANILNSVSTMCDVFDGPFSDIYTSRDFWYTIDEKQLVQYMRQAYTNKGSFKSEGLNVARKYSFESIGTMMKEVLGDK